MSKFVELKPESVGAIRASLREINEIEEKIEALRKQAELLMERVPIISMSLAETIYKIEGFEVCEIDTRYVEEIGKVFGKRCTCLDKTGKDRPSLKTLMEQMGMVPDPEKKH